MPHVSAGRPARSSRVHRNPLRISQDQGKSLRSAPQGPHACQPADSPLHPSFRECVSSTDWCILLASLPSRRLRETQLACRGVVCSRNGSGTRQGEGLIKAAGEQDGRLGRVPGHRLHLAAVVRQRVLARLRHHIPHLHSACKLTTKSRRHDNVPQTVRYAFLTALLPILQPGHPVKYSSPVCMCPSSMQAMRSGDECLP